LNEGEDARRAGTLFFGKLELRTRKIQCLVKTHKVWQYLIGIGIIKLD